MSKYRLLALDLDSTLLTDDKNISEANKKWIQKARDAGVTVIFSTGRGLSRVERYLEELQLDTPMVLVNGGEVWHQPGDVKTRHYLKRDHVRTLHQIAVEADAHFWGYDVEKMVGKKSWKPEMFDRDWLKFGISDKDGEKMRKLWKQVEDWGQVEVTGKSHRSMEISVRGVTKESGIREVCEMLDYDIKEVMAIGDGPNDYYMLRGVGLGVAMANGEEEIKEVADVITDTNEQDGVAKAIQKYIFELS